MNEAGNIKRILQPAIKGLPIIALFLIISLLLASRAIRYKNPMYESTAKLKLDDKTSGFSNSNLYKDFDLFTSEHKLLTEVEVLKSSELIKKALKNLDFNVGYFRVGSLRTSELYHESPFVAAYKIYNEDIYSLPLNVAVLSDNRFTINYNIKGQERVITGNFGEWIENDDIQINLEKNNFIFSSKDKVDIIDNYLVKIYSTEQLVNIIKSDLDIKEVDKDISVIRISYRSEIPEKAEKMVNSIGKTYIKDYVKAKTSAASRTVDFIDDRLTEVKASLKQSEYELEGFKKDYKVVNTYQETETGIREISQLKIQLNNLIMKEAAIDSLNKYINESEKDFLELAPQVAFGDLLFTELVKKLKFYQGEKMDLLIMYKPKHEKVVAVDAKIADIISYIKESIQNARREVSIQKRLLEETYLESSKSFDNLPEREKKQLVLERNFVLNQNTYNFLMEKRTEAAIVEASGIAFHRIIEYGSLPKQPISPNKNLILIVSGFLGLIFAIALIYTRLYLRSQLSSRSELEAGSAIPISGFINHFSKRAKANAKLEIFSTLVSNLELIDIVKKGARLQITSTIRGEGKSFIAEQLAIALANLGWKTLIIDFDLRHPYLSNNFLKGKSSGLSGYFENAVRKEDLICQSEYENLSFIPAGSAMKNISLAYTNKQLKRLMKDLESDYDIIVIDSPATALAIDAVKIMPFVTHVLYVSRINFTQKQYIKNADLIAEEYQFKHIKHLLNGLQKTNNYNGFYAGSKYSYINIPKGFSQKIVHYFNYYLR